MPIRPLTYSAGYTLKTVLRDYSTGVERCWRTDTNAFEAYDAANIAAYGIAVAAGSPGEYWWTVPAALPALLSEPGYVAITYQIAGASLAVGDLEATVVRSTFGWDGTAFVAVATTAGLTTVGTALAALAAVAPDHKPDVNADGEVAGQADGAVGGPGADSCTLMMSNETSGLAIADADVWITSDMAGTAVVAGTLQTNSDGEVTFLLDDGATYYLWMQKDGVNPIRGQLFTAEAD